MNTVAPKDPFKEVTLYNRGKRKVMGHMISGRDETGQIVKAVHPETGKPVSFEFMPEKSHDFNAETAEFLRGMYPKELVSMDDVKQEFTAITAPVIAPDEMQARIDKAVEARLEKVLQQRSEALMASADTIKPVDGVYTQEQTDALIESALAAERIRISESLTKLATDADSDAAAQGGEVSEQKKSTVGLFLKKIMGG